MQWASADLALSTLSSEKEERARRGGLVTNARLKKHATLMEKQNATFTPFPASFYSFPLPTGFLRRGLSQDKRGNKRLRQGTQLGSSRKCGLSDGQFDSSRIIQPFLFYLLPPLIVHLWLLYPPSPPHGLPFVSMISGCWFFRNPQPELSLSAWGPPVTLTWVLSEPVFHPLLDPAHAWLTSCSIRAHGIPEAVTFLGRSWGFLLSLSLFPLIPPSAWHSLSSQEYSAALADAPFTDLSPRRGH